MESNTGIVRGTLTVVVVAFCFSLSFLFPRVGFLACCFFVVGLAYLFWQIYLTVQEKPLGFLTYLVPLGIMVGFFLVYWGIDNVVHIKESQPRIEIANQLKQIAIALHAYKDEHGSFPPAAVYNREGKPLYSWRVAILPFLEREELYAQFHLDEPWDSPHNLPLLDQVPAAFRPPELVVAPDPRATYYQVFVGPGAAFEGNKGLSRADFGDSLEKIILVVEAREAVPWTKPVDLSFAPDQTPPELGSPRRRRLGRLVFGEYLPFTFGAAMGDGHVETFETGFSPANLRELITRNGSKSPKKNKEESTKDRKNGD